MYYLRVPASHRDSGKNKWNLVPALKSDSERELRHLHVSLSFGPLLNILDWESRTVVIPGPGGALAGRSKDRIEFSADACLCGLFRGGTERQAVAAQSLS